MSLGLQVFKECCKNCLLSEDRIVSAKYAKEIIDDCKQTQQYFVCHKASMNDEEVVCASFYKDLGHISQTIRIAERLGVIEFIDQIDLEKLPSHKEMNNLK